MIEKKPFYGDYFAELYVAGVMANAGWNIYFPRRDQGFDFIISKTDNDGLEIIRPIQVKGKYPSQAKTNKREYGYVGKLSRRSDDMVLVIPYFSYGKWDQPECIAYMPLSCVKSSSRGFSCQPAAFKNGKPEPRRDFLRFFNKEGLKAMERKDFSKIKARFF